MSGEGLDDLAKALALVDIDYYADRKQAKEPVQGSFPLADYQKFGELVAFGEEELVQLRALRDMVVRFVKQSDHEHPLCFAVFGPPGSGKSFAVKEIQKQAESEAKRRTENERLRLVRTTINLTQLADSSELTGALVAVLMADAEDSNVIPMVLFDEFDTTRGGAPYGWLSYFLAPMHDGEFFHDGKNIKLKRAIYVFAGGTATTMQEFSGRHDAGFRDAKGPDFVSRLRGYLNVPGPNSSPRMLRRAIILRSEIQKRVKRHGTGMFRMDRELLHALLQAGRYRHGARSIAALVELAELDPQRDRLDWNMLPDDHLVALHVDRGPLDPRAIGGSIALSGFPPVGGADVGALHKCWTHVATELWNHGATLAYAGRVDRELNTLLLKELSRRPLELCRQESSRQAPYPRFRSFQRGFSTTRETDNALILPTKSTESTESKETKGPKEIGLEFVETYLDDDERAWGKSDPRAKVVERFRRRLAVSEASVARFIVGGKWTPGDDRPSGIVEEAVLSLALARPIYLAGGFGGAAADLGIVLGLADIRTGVIPDSLKDHMENNVRDDLTDIVERLRPPPFTSLPVFPDEQVCFLREHALGCPGWPYNGLSSEENRRLFRSRDPGEVAMLVVDGLVQLYKDR